MTEQSLEDYLSENCKKLDQLATATVFIQNKKHVGSALIAIQDEVTFMKKGLDSARTDLGTMKNQIETLKGLSKIVDKMKDKINHMELNLPPKLLHDYASMQSSESENPGAILTDKKKTMQNFESDLSDDVFGEDDEDMVKDCKKSLFNEPEVFPRIQLLDQAEFQLIPKYMIGRQTLDVVNRFIDTINEILHAKYSLMALGPNGARKKGESDLYAAYKRQESVNAKGHAKVYFFTAEDYHRHAKTKLNKAKLNLLTVLRHCKRMREIRVPNAIQYAVVSSV